VALEKAGGYYYSTGGSEAIVRGDIKVRQGEIAAFESGRTVAFRDGSKEHFDVVVFATGYTGVPDTVRATLGET
jgi:cation diffusion facilitator CzcD-associated flavoprotein CzcO